MRAAIQEEDSDEEISNLEAALSDEEMKEITAIMK